jgi:hypothetical protein
VSGVIETGPGDPLEELFSVAYEELRRLASLVRRDDRNATMSPTTLVNEAFLKLTVPGSWFMVPGTVNSEL